MTDNELKRRVILIRCLAWLTWDRITIVNYVHDDTRIRLQIKKRKKETLKNKIHSANYLSYNLFTRRENFNSIRLVFFVPIDSPGSIRIVRKLLKRITALTSYCCLLRPSESASVNTETFNYDKCKPTIRV